MEVKIDTEIEIDNAFLKQLVIIREVMNAIKPCKTLRFSTIGPIKITVETSEIVRKYARKLNIITTRKGIAFIIQNKDDTEMILRKIQDLNKELMLHESAQI